MSSQLLQIAAPDEFALRQWRAFRRLKGWKGLPLALAVVLFLAISPAAFLMILLDAPSEDILFGLALLVQQFLPGAAYLATGMAFFTRKATWQTLLELSLSPTPPHRWLLSSFRVVQTIVFGCNLVLVGIFLHGAIPDMDGTAEELIFLVLYVLNSLLLAWFLCYVMLNVMLKVQSRMLGGFLFFLAQASLQILTYTILMVVAEVGSPAPIIVLGTLLLIAVPLVGLFCKAGLQAAAEGAVARMVE